MTTPDLVSRLLEAIEETERAAREPADYSHGLVWGSPSGGVLDTGEELIPLGDATLVHHIVRNDPSSVLRRCSADRKILELHKPKVYETDEWGENRVLVDVEYLYCPRCWAAADYPAHSNPPERYPCDHVRLLVEAYGLEVTE